MKHNYLFTACLTFLALSTFAQELDPACEFPNKKAQKLIDAAKGTTNSQTATQNFVKALEANPDNAGVLYEYGLFTYNCAQTSFDGGYSKLGETYLKKSEDLLESANELCNDYHAEIPYLLAVINFTQEDKTFALEWLKKFIEYKNSDPSRYTADHDSRKKDAKAVFIEEEKSAAAVANTVPFEPKIVKNVSSSTNDEYFPMISPDNLYMFFTRKQDMRNLGDQVSKIQEVYTFSKREEEASNFDAGTPFPKPFNDGSFVSYGASSVSVDNKEMIICACQKTNVQGQPYLNCDLFSTNYQKIGPTPKDYEWTKLKSLGTQINSSSCWEGQPSLSADGQTLYYVKNGPETKDNDVFVVKRNTDGTWGNPRSFDEINTAGKDKSPFLHQDSETLYFVSTVSDKRPGVGGTDIFYMREENGVWTEPKNIGFPINTAEDELGLFVSMDGKLAYYSSKSEGNWNIYGFELYEDARPKSVTILKGTLSAADGSPIENASIEVAYANSDMVEQVKVNGNDGKYAVVIKTEVAQDIIVSVKKEGVAFQSVVIEKEKLKEPETLKNNDLEVKELKIGEAYTINDILYAYNSDVLTDKSKFILREFSRFLKSNQTLSIVIQGHTDSDGDDKENLDLSERRASGVRNYLISLGIDQSRLKSQGFGEGQAKMPNDTAENKALNRRTEFKITEL